MRLGDRGAARGIIVDDDRIEFDVGLDAAFPVDSDDNDAREGMNDLDFLLELGPRLTYRFLPPEDRDELDLAFAVRAVLSTDFGNLRYQGLTLNPSLTYRRNDFILDDMRGVVSLSPLFGFDGLNDYFYRVSPSEARPGRPAFEADDGYIGTELSIGALLGHHGEPARLRRRPGRLLGPLGQRRQPAAPRRLDRRRRRRPALVHLHQRAPRGAVRRRMWGK